MLACASGDALEPLPLVVRDPCAFATRIERHIHAQLLDHHGLADDAFRAEWAARRAPLVTGAAELPEARRLKERLEPPQRAHPDDTPVALTELASFDALLEGRA